MCRSILFALLLVLSLVCTAQANTRLSDAAALYENNQLTRAQSLLNDILDNSPSDPQAILLLTTVLLAQNQVSQALDMLEDNASLLNRFAGYYNNLAYAYFYKGKDAKAVKMLERGIELDKRYSTLYDNLATIFAFKAKAAYEQAMEDKPTIQRTLPTLKLVADVADIPVKTVAAASSPANVNLKEESARIKQAMKRWAQAWSEKRVEDYLSVYSPKFKTPQGVTMQSWKSFRRDRIHAPRFIEVKAYNFDIELAGDGSLASVHFLQHYRSNTLNDRVLKHVVMQQEDNEWKIISENVTN